ncbi:MAG: AAA family ATPase [Proteobacteria bacterium]|nr:AAA family ATPase [Pseudomonadota bacterium]
MMAADIFVGRQAELDRLLEAAVSARAGRGQLVLLSGEPGIGKTRTAAEIGARTGMRALWGRSHESAGAPPYWPWTQVLRGPLAQADLAVLREDFGPGAADVADIVPDLRERVPGLEPPPPSRDPAEARFRLFDSLTRFLLATARRSPLLIVLDDLHWADVPSLRLLEFLTPEIASSPILMIGTYRDTELSRHHPLSDTLGGLIRDSHVARLRLAGLDGEEVRHFVAHAAGVVPPPSLTRSIHQQTEGNPLFVREVVRLLSEQGHFAAGHGAAPATIRIPEGIRDVIGRRLNRLSRDCNEILTLAAIAGRDFAADVLAQASGRPADTVLSLLDEASAARVIEETDADRYQFTHALIRETLYDEIPPGQRRRLHRSVGTALAALAQHDAGPVLADLARHFQAAGAEADLQRAIGYAAAAGKRANALFAFEDAAKLFEAALDMIDEAAEPDRRLQADVLLNLGESLRNINDYPASIARLHAAAEIARAEGFHNILAAAALSYAAAIWRWENRTGSETLAFLRGALEVIPDSMRDARIRLTAAIGRALLYADEREAAVATVARAVEQARALGDPSALVTALDAFYQLNFELLSPDRLRDERELTRLAEQVRDLDVTSRSWFRRYAFHAIRGDVAQAREALEAYDATQERIRQPDHTTYAIGIRTAHAIMAGDLPQAERLIVEALRMRTPFGTAASDLTAMTTFDLRRAQGRLAELRPLIQAFARTQGSAAWQPGLAVMLLETGDAKVARELFEALASDDFAAIPRDGLWTASMTYLAETSVALGDSARAAVLYRLLRPWAGYNFVLGGGASLPGSADRFLGGLSAVMRRWTEAEAHFTAALAMNDRLGARLPLAHAQVDYASMLLARGFPGDRTRAQTLLLEAHGSASTLDLTGVLSRIKGLMTALDAGSLATPDDLTAREIEVLRLLAIGRSNADIALVLSISLNTVATHVRNILAKTGCANRTEAAAYGMRHRLHAGA